MHVGACLAGGRHPVYGAHRLALHQDDALVAVADRRQIGLGDDRLAKECAEHLDERVEVLVLGPDVEHARAAVAEEGLEDDVAVLSAKIDDHVALGGDERRRHQLGEPCDEEFLRRVSHLGRIVDHQRLGLDLLQDMGGRDVGHVERRVLAHQDDVHGGEVDGLRRTKGEVIAGLPAHLEGRTVATAPASVSERCCGR